MKKIIAKLTILSFLSLLVSCSGGTSSTREETSSSNFSYGTKINSGEEYVYANEESRDIGPFIDGVIAYSNSELYSVGNVTNDSGMSGAESYLHTHTSGEPRDNMWLSAKDKTDNSVILKLPRPAQIGKVYFWNYNNFAKIDSSVKDFQIEYSSDGGDYVSFKEGELFTLDQSQGDSALSGQAIDLEGISTQFIKIVPISNYGGDYFGLSEIRIYQYKNKMEKGSRIAANIMEFETEPNIVYEENMCNGSGISSVNSSDGKVSNNPYYMYKAIDSQATFTFNGNYPLSKVSIWNYNDPDYLGLGVKDCSFSYSIDGSSWISLGEYTIAQATGSNSEAVSSEFEFENVSMQYLRLNYTSNYAGTSYYGLSEIRFYAGEGSVTELDIEHTGWFSSYDSGWAGADGIFNTRLSGDNSIGSDGDSFFNFSDTYVGTVNSITKLRNNNVMQNNSFATLGSDGILSFITSNEAVPFSPEKDETRSSADAFYWLGDTFVVEDTLYVSVLYIAQEGALGFTQKGEDLIALDIVQGEVDFSSARIIKDSTNNKLAYVSDEGDLSIIFGAAIFENTIQSNALNPDGYIYNYGYMDDTRETYNPRTLVVSRVKKESVEDFSQYEYFDGTDWSNDITSCRGLIDYVACEMSIVEMNDPESEDYGKFILTYEKYTISNDICIAKSDSLFGLFTDSKVIYDAPEKITMANVSNYNAKMHPTLSTSDRLVISYNLNESKAGVNNSNADIYRPRFVYLSQI